MVLSFFTLFLVLALFVVYLNDKIFLAAKVTPLIYTFTPVFPLAPVEWNIVVDA